MKFARLMREHASVAIPLAAICILAAAMVIAAQQPTPSSDTASRVIPSERSADAQPKNAEPLTEPAPVSADAFAATPQTADAKAARVTITGCLERADEAFRLKDTTGADAPKARNWRWGFLKKGPASVQVVDASTSVRLRDHIGQRVTVTGMLVDRAMQVRSLQRVSPSCVPSRVKI